MSNKRMGSIISTGDKTGTGKDYEALQLVNNNSINADTRDIDYLRARFYQVYGCDTNDILTLFSFWQSNFSNYTQQPKIMSQQVVEMTTSPNIDNVNRLTRFSGPVSNNQNSMLGHPRSRLAQ